MIPQHQYKQAWDVYKDHWFLVQTRKFLEPKPFHYYYEQKPGLLQPEHFPHKDDRVWKAFIYEFGWTIPSEVLLGVLALKQPIVEIGCGTGFIAEICYRRNIMVSPTDKTKFAKEYGLTTWPVINIAIEMDALTAIKFAKNSDSNLFLSWPYPALSGTDNQAWQNELIEKMNPEQVLILVAEYRGCTGTSEFWDMVQNRGLCEFQTLEIPNFVGYHTQLFIITRK